MIKTPRWVLELHRCSVVKLTKHTDTKNVRELHERFSVVKLSTQDTKNVGELHERCSALKVRLLNFIYDTA